MPRLIARRRARGKTRADLPPPSALDGERHPDQVFLSEMA